MDPAARLGGQPVAEPAEPLREVPAVARAAATGQEGRQVREQPDPEHRGVERVHQRRASSSTCQLNPRSAASTSLRAASSPARSAARETRMGSPKRTTQRAKGRGIRNSSQERSRHSREAPDRHRHDRRAGEPRQRDHPGLEHLARAPRAVGHDDDFAAVAERAGQHAERVGAPARGGARAPASRPNRRIQPGHHLAVARAAGEHVGAAPPVELGQQQEARRATSRRSRGARAAQSGATVASSRLHAQGAPRACARAIAPRAGPAASASGAGIFIRPAPCRARRARRGARPPARRGAPAAPRRPPAGRRPPPGRRAGAPASCGQPRAGHLALEQLGDDGAARHQVGQADPAARGSGRGRSAR